MIYDVYFLLLYKSTSDFMSKKYFLHSFKHIYLSISPLLLQTIFLRITSLGYTNKPHILKDLLNNNFSSIKQSFAFFYF